MKRFSIILAFVFGAIAISQAQVIRNGSFENATIQNGYWVGGLTADGWTFNENAGIAMGDSAWGRAGHSGSKYAYLQSAGAGTGMFCQVVQGFTVGQKYQLSFWMARRNTAVKEILGANVSTPVEVTADNKVIFNFTDPKGQGEWVLYKSKPFVATTIGMTFTFLTETCHRDSATLVDDVVLTPVKRSNED